MRNRLPLFWVKVFYYEYWPFWIFFLPLVPYWIYLSIRARSMTYFTAANPSIPHSGVFGESKMHILNKIDTEYLPTSLFMKKSDSWYHVAETMDKHGLSFPIILKPNVGERGSQVEKIDYLDSLKAYMTKNTEDFILQEYVSAPLELGVLYYRIPASNEKGIVSIVIKEFLQVTGDGVSSIEELILKYERAHLHLKELQRKYGSQLKNTLPTGDQFLLQPIGNHCKGTKFLSGQHLITSELVDVFDKVSSNIEGFNFGRFDLRVSSVEDLKAGKNLKIMELNGVTSEPGHIYDPQLSLIKAYLDTAKSMKTMFKVSQASRKLGAEVTPIRDMVRLIRDHFSDQQVAPIEETSYVTVTNALGNIQ